jgi:hypothetical protein
MLNMRTARDRHKYRTLNTKYIQPLDRYRSHAGPIMVTFSKRRELSASPVKLEYESSQSFSEMLELSAKRVNFQ